MTLHYQGTLVVIIAWWHGATAAIIVSSDADVVVIAVSLMLSIGLTKLWTAFGKGKDFRWIPAHDIAAALGPKALALPFFSCL